MPLTDAAIRNAKPREKAYKLSDSGGLYQGFEGESTPDRLSAFLSEAP